MASDKKTTVEEPKVELKGAEAPKIINIEIPDEPSPKPEAKQDGDLGAVRQGMSEAVPFIGRLLGKKDATAAKPKKEEAATEATETEAKKVEDGKASDDRMAESVLKVKPKKREAGKKEEEPAPEKPEPKQGMSVEEVAEVASAAVVKAMRTSQPAPEKKEPAKKSSKEYPEEYRQNAQVFDYLAVAKPDQYGDIKERLIAFDDKHRKYVSDWEEENPGEKFDADAEDHAEFYNKNFPDIDLDDVDQAEEEVQKAKFSAEAKRVAEEHVKPLRDQLERKEVEARVAAVMPVIQKDEVALLKTVLEAILPEEVGDLKMDPESLKKTRDDFEMEAEIANEVATPAADLIGTYQLIANRIVPYDPKDTTHATLVESLERLERFIQSRPVDERIRDGKRFVPLEKFVAMKPEEQKGFWAINHDEVVAWIAEEARQTAVKRWEKRKSQLDRYSSRSGGSVTVAVRKATPPPEENGSANPFISSVVGPGGGDSGRGHVGYGEQVRSNPAKHGIGALMRSIGMVKVSK